MLRIRQLPISSAPSLLSATTATTWEQEAWPSTTGLAGRWWMNVPPMTVPQLLGYVQQRPPSRVSWRSMVGFSRKIQREPRLFRVEPVTRYARVIWAETHQSLLFRLTAQGRVAGRQLAAEANAAAARAGTGGRPAVRGRWGVEGAPIPPVGTDAWWAGVSARDGMALLTAGGVGRAFATCAPGERGGRLRLLAWLRWAEPDVAYEERMLFWPRGLGATTGRLRRDVRDAIHAAARRGWVTDVRAVTLPVVGVTLSEDGARALGVRVGGARWAALAHHLVAVEAALAIGLQTADSADTDRWWAGVQGLVGDSQLRGAALTTALAATHGRVRPGRGSVPLPGFADVQYRDVVGRVRSIEVLSTDYKRGDVAAKYDELGSDMTFVATSRAVATRASRDIPTADVHYFA